MRKIMRTASAIALAAIAIMSVSAATASAATQGCSSGTVCLYPQNTGWNGGFPSDHWFRYGTVNLVNQFGTHRFFNNQTGGAGVYLCTGSNGTGTCSRLNAGSWRDYNFTPINSITLTPN